MNARVEAGGVGLALALGLAACAPNPWASGGAALRPSFQLAALSEALKLEASSVVEGVASFQGMGPLGEAGAKVALELPLEAAQGYRLAQSGGLTVRFVLSGPNFAAPLIVELRVPAGVRLCSVTIGGLPPGPCSVQVQLVQGGQAQPFATTQVSLTAGTTAQAPTLPSLGSSPSPRSPAPTAAPSAGPSQSPLSSPPASAGPATPTGGGGGGGGGGSSSTPAPTPTPPGDVEVELSVGEAPASPAPLAPDPAFPELPATTGGL